MTFIKNGKKKILIVGAGLAGLAMYLALDKRKFDVEIIEKKKKFRRLGYSLIFMPLGVRALKNLGFTSSQISALGKNIQENRLKDKNGKLVRVTNFRPLIKEFDKYMMVTRQRLYHLLEKKTRSRDIHFGINTKSLSPTLNGKAYVRFTGTKESKEYDAIIGADGTRSFVRQALFPHAKLRPLGLSLIWTWIPQIKGIYPQQPGAVGNEKGGVGFFNSGERGQSCMAFFLQTKNIPRSTTSKDYKNILREHLKDFGGPVPKILKHLPAGNQMYLHEDYELDLKKWHKGNIVLIGDAAHTRSAFSGAGCALALEDALVLGHYLNRENTLKIAIEKYVCKQKARMEKLAMARLRLYLQDQKGITKYLKNFFASSLLYEKK